MFDIDFFEHLNLLLGARYDDAHAETTDFERFAQTSMAAQNCSSSSAVVGRILPETVVEGDDDATPEHEPVVQFLTAASCRT
jgi:hypothetical protein